MVYSMDQLAQQGGATQVLTTHKSDLGVCASVEELRKKKMKESLWESERDQVELSSWLLLILGDAFQKCMQMYST